MNRTINLIHSEQLNRGGYPEGCPFSSKRAQMVLDLVASVGMDQHEQHHVIPSQPLDRTLLERFHTANYLDTLQKTSGGHHDFKALKMGLGTPDCPVFKGMYEYAALAGGGSVVGAKRIIEHKADIVFNPSGGFHHAQKEAASGFCYLNDVVLACMVLRDAGLKVAVVDVDAHHLDSVQDAFYADDRVTTISLHESGDTLFPGTGDVTEIGVGDGLGHAINVPFPVGTYDGAYLRAFDELVLPALKRIKPDVIVLELGMDGLSSDPLAHLNLSNNVFATITERLYRQNLPMLVTGGGGYNVEDTVRGWALCYGVLLEGGQDDLLINAGLGGVMLENTAWFGGLRDRTLLSHGGYRQAVDEQIDQIIAQLKKTIPSIADN